MAKSYFRASEFTEEIYEKRDETFSRGFEIGFHSAYNYLNLKKKSTSYWFADPFSGKTALILDIYMYIARRYDAKIAIYSPESGGKTAVVSYLVQVYLGKKLHGKQAKKATDAEWVEALNFIDNHFIILAPKVLGKDAVPFTYKELVRQLDAASKEYKWKLDIIFIDPLTMLRKDDDDRKKSVADYILDTLYYFNQLSEIWDVHIQIAMHTSDTDSIFDKDTGKEYKPKPHASRLNNGQNVQRTGQLMVGLWRTPEGVIEKSTGMPYPKNSTDVLIQKNKILGAGEVGDFRLFFDVEKQKFYEIIDGNKYYCGEYETNKPTDNAIKPNEDFDPPF